MWFKIVANLALAKTIKLLPGVILPGVILIALFNYFLKDYFLFNSFSVFGILLLPIFIPIDQEKRSFRFLFITLAFLVLSYCTPINTLIYVSWICALIFFIENSIGKTGFIFFIYLILISPIFVYAGNFIGIPARLQLTDIAGNILNLINFQNEVAGNMIITEQGEFSVDPACMGLNMLNISFLLAILIVFHHEKRTGYKLNFLYTNLYLLLVLLLNIFGNLVRILMLVIFRIPAENILHDAMGIVCLVLYVIIPLWYISIFLYKKGVAKKINVTVIRMSKYRIGVMYCLLGILFSVGYSTKTKIKEKSYLPEICVMNGYKKSIAAKDVLKFEDSNSLIYIKPVSSFYGAEHTPMICWVGSGYSFKQVKKIFISNREIFVGKLEKGKDTFYCSWWFDNGTTKTIDQFQWRWDVVKGKKPYSLININATNEKILYEKTKELLSKNIFINQ